MTYHGIVDELQRLHVLICEREPTYRRINACMTSAYKTIEAHPLFLALAGRSTEIPETRTETTLRFRHELTERAKKQHDEEARLAAEIDSATATW